MMSAPTILRSLEMVVRSAPALRSHQSLNRSEDTTEFALSNRAVSSRRCVAEPNRSGAPSDEVAARGPRI
jgi:hypothetical protein